MDRINPKTGKPWTSVELGHTETLISRRPVEPHDPRDCPRCFHLLHHKQN